MEKLQSDPQVGVIVEDGEDGDGVVGPGVVVEVGFGVGFDIGVGPPVGVEGVDGGGGLFVVGYLTGPQCVPSTSGCK
jgi:hypothetical protein